MFEQAVMASEACRQSAGTRYGALIPALCGCLRCERVQMVASPDLGVCPDCGEEFSVLDASNLAQSLTG